MHTVQLKDLPSTPIPLDSVIDTAIVRLSRVWCAGQPHLAKQTAVWGLPRLATACQALVFVPSCCTQPVPYTHYDATLHPWQMGRMPHLLTPRKFQRTCARKSIAPCHAHKSHPETATRHCATTIRQRRLGLEAQRPGRLLIRSEKVRDTTI
jgi:hypothetical protein